MNKFSISLIRTTFILISILLTISCSRPDFHFTDGTNASLQDYQGRWVVINYWAEWCKPCLEEVPELNRFQALMQDSVVLLSISYDKLSNEAMLEQQKKYGIEYPVIASAPAPRLDIPMPSALPANYLISPDGQRFGPVLGPQDAVSLAELVKAYETKWLASKQ